MVDLGAEIAIVWPGWNGGPNGIQLNYLLEVEQKTKGRLGNRQPLVLAGFALNEAA